jgi:hypothetical protein
MASPYWVPLITYLWVPFMLPFLVPQMPGFTDHGNRPLTGAGQVISS